MKMAEMYKFIDWYNESYDRYCDTFEEAKKLFDEAIAENKEARVSIYLIQEEIEGVFDEEGILFNDNCPDYSW